MLVELNVVGSPYPQGSKRAFVVKGRAVITEGGSASGQKKHKAWRKAVEDEARASYTGDLMDCAISCEMDFYLVKPKSQPAWKKYVSVPYDLDKLVRNVFDALTGTVWKDDSRVSVLRAKKMYADLSHPEGCVIRISDIPENRS